MERDHIEVLEEPSGVGRVTHEDGRDFGDFHYRLRVTQVMHGNVEGLKDVDGDMTPVADDSHVLLYKLIGESPLVLQLEDGRTMRFFFKASDGEIRAIGGLESKA